MNIFIKVHCPKLTFIPLASSSSATINWRSCWCHYMYPVLYIVVFVTYSISQYTLTHLHIHCFHVRRFRVRLSPVRANGGASAKCLPSVFGWQKVLINYHVCQGFNLSVFHGCTTRTPWFTTVNIDLILGKHGRVPHTTHQCSNVRTHLHRNRGGGAHSCEDSMIRKPK